MEDEHVTIFCGGRDVSLRFVVERGNDDGCLKSLGDE